jgi:hypothetical protein
VNCWLVKVQRLRMSDVWGVEVCEGQDSGCYGCDGLLGLIVRFIGYIQQL